MSTEEAEELIRQKAEKEDELTLSEKLLIESAAEKETGMRMRIKPEPIEQTGQRVEFKVERK